MTTNSSDGKEQKKRRKSRKIAKSYVSITEIAKVPNLGGGSFSSQNNRLTFDLYLGVHCKV